MSDVSGHFVVRVLFNDQSCIFPLFNPSGAPEFTHGFLSGCVAQSSVFCVSQCLSFCLFTFVLFVLRYTVLITPLVSSNFSFPHLGLLNNPLNTSCIQYYKITTHLVRFQLSFVVSLQSRVQPSWNSVQCQQQKQF